MRNRFGRAPLTHTSSDGGGEGKSGMIKSHRYWPSIGGAFAMILTFGNIAQSANEPPTYSINTQAAPGAQVTTSYSHNQLSTGLTSAYGYYQTAFPSMNDLGIVVARIPGSAVVRPPMPIWQVPPTGDGTGATVWENGVAKQLTWPLVYGAGAPYDGWLSQDKRVILEVRGCKDYYLDGTADVSTCGGRATAINNAGTIVGSNHDWPPMGSPYFEKPKMWRGALTHNSPSFPISTITSYAWSQITNPTDINESGAVVGTGITEGGAGPQDTFEHGLVDIPNQASSYIGVHYQRSRAHAINESNTVTGTSYYDANNTYDGTGKPWRAYTWNNGVLTWISVLANSTYSEGFDINDSNVVVGIVTNASNQNHAFRWDSAAGMVDLGTLGGAESVARSINNAGDIVGAAMNASGQMRAFIFKSGVMYDLNNYIPAAGWTLVDAYTINERGQILVRGNNASLGDAYLILNPPAVDQGNSIATALQVSLNSDTAGAIETAGDVDYFKFVLDNAGVLSVSAAGSTDTYGDLRDANGNIIVSNDNGSTLNFSLNRALTAGTYYLSVRHASNAATGAYTLVTRFVADDGGANFESTLLDVNGSRNASIELAGDADMFILYLPSAGNLTVKTTGGTNTYGTLTKVDGTVVATNDNFTDGNFRIQADLLVGKYYLKVTHSSATGTGAYTVSSQFTPAPPVADDSGDTIATATSIAPGVVKAGRIGTYGDNDYYVFTTTQTTNIVISLPSAMPVASELYNSTGGYLTGSNASSGNLEYIYMNAAPGTYYVRVVHYYNLGIGDYNLLVKLDVEGNDTSRTVNLPVGGSVSGTIDYGLSYNPVDTDVYKIDVTTAGWLTLQSTSTLDVSAYLTNSTGSWLGMNDNYFGSGNFKITANVPVGTYYLYVSSQARALGTYSVSASIATSEPTDSVGNTTATATALVPGSSYSAGIEYFGDVDYYRFDATARGYLKVGVTATNSITVSVVDASGSTVKSRSYSPYDIGYAVPAAGTYYIKIERNTFELMSYNLSGITFTYDDAGDTMATASALALPGNITANIYPGDADYYALTVASAGLLSISAPAGSNLYTYVLNSSGGYVYGTPPLPNGSVTAAINVAAGTYYVYVFNNVTTDLVSYTLNANLSATAVDDAGNTVATAKTIALNSTTVANFETSNDVDFFRLDITSPVILDIGTTGNIDTAFYLQTSNSNLMFSDDAGGTWGLNGHVVYGITEPGTYYLYVYKKTSAIGTYNVVNSTSALPVDDHGNGFANATTISIGGSANGKFEFAGDRDYFKFQVNGTQGAYIFSTNATGITLAALFDANGTLLTTVDTGYYYYYNFGMKYPVVSGQTYYLKLYGLPTQPGSTYTLNVQTIADDVGNSFANATNVALNSTTPGIIDFERDIDYFRFDVTGTNGLDVWFTGAGNLTVYDAAGNSLGYTGTASQHVTLAAVPGTYYAMMTSAYYNSYTLEVRGLTDDAGNNIATAVPLANDGTVRNGNIDYINDIDYLVVQIPSGYALDLYNGGTLNTYSTVYDANGNSQSVLSDANGPPGTYRHIRFTPPSAGTYYVRVAAYVYNTTGAYTVQASLAAITPPVTDAVGNTIATATTVAVNSTTSSIIDYAGDIDYFRIDIPTGGVLDLSTISGIDSYGYLYNASGTLLTYQDDGGGTYGLNFHISYTVTAGTYYVITQAGARVHIAWCLV